ncbi:pyridoxal 5'-phosphate synthase glutaminase subunit PdxT [Alpinimonas psychrophila]|uniref:Pyridoxal 5'-phosphate synthase subunit PdxT n=1 Tax=Alpinimonas psychrophila TaxID=748908 RepID=A0A7W3JSR4_9MICO|nr:pyridoxal 5'-phosphate synthase glutaminase subunit PdxT [Alpinimonas psychrophila]MBA8828546.1 5'-phosphate synthase pdxT subunit [Alpinimonas psychrophila]
MSMTFRHPTASLIVVGKPLRIGVLAFQGDVREHIVVLERLGAEVIKVRRPEELGSVDGLVIPGGESSVMDKLVRLFGLYEPLKAAIAAGLPVFGTCAGLIMLSRTVLDAMDDQKTLGGLDVDVRRNAFGTQVDSFETNLSIPEITSGKISATFIRAPIVERVGPDVKVLARLEDGRIVAVEQGNLLGISFHPEVNGDTRVHEYFLGRVATSLQPQES